MSDRAQWAKRQLAYEFSDEELLNQALTHRSASKTNNERLEFLGDALLSFTVAAELYARRPDATEGDLSRARAALVKKDTLARIGRRIGIDEQLVLGSGELRSGGAHRASALADAVEALIGAVYIDGGFGVAEALVRRLLEAPLAELPDSESLKDPKTRLQEWLQARGWALPIYTVDAVTGSDHNQCFVVRCDVIEREKSCSGQGTSRRRAEQAAAKNMLEELQCD
ncbi:MAG: ribonuclease III [Gammaproteobacteria bacterium]|nr:ribonuclease III [Gammaproteobacteria bacterium]